MIINRLILSVLVLAYLSVFAIAACNDQPVRCTTDDVCAVMYPDVEPY
jgi:hypothetical protein